MKPKQSPAAHLAVVKALTVQPANNRPRCSHCHQPIDAPQTLADGATACGPSCALALIYARVEAMTTPDAEYRFRELWTRCVVEDGKTGGLYQELADELRFLANRLGVALEWQRVELGVSYANAK